MKRSELSYSEWKCITEKTLCGKNVKTAFVDGYIGLLKIHKVSEPQIWKFHGEDIVVCDGGLQWLSILPKNDFYCITAMMNEKSEVLLWYIDMTADQGTDKDGIPWFDDLYLDLVVYPNGEILEDDMNELEEALAQRDITQEQFDLALDTAQRLRQGLLADIGQLKEYTGKCLELVV